MLSKLSNSKFLIPMMIFIAVLAAASGFYISLKQSSPARPDIEGLFWPAPKQIHDFSVVDQNGNPFNLSNIQGKWSFVFFGYTHCPDVCPITMAIMADVYKQLVDTGYNDVQTIFVSVDPERDTTEKLNQYVAYFNEDFIGLGGNIEMIKSLTQQIGVAYFHSEKDEKGFYLVDHTASLFLFDPGARMIAKISAPHESTEIMQRFKNIKAFVDAQN